jgi:lipopolysaccharide transport system ATP-binding protein
MTDSVIKVRGLGKRYRIGELQSRDAKSIFSIAEDIYQGSMRAMRFVINPASFREEDSHIWALRDVSFEVKRGESLGVIGHNGAGKSTLLKILTRITDPTEGEICLRGRVGALLEVGTGFSGMLSGRENIYLNGAILGMTKREIDRKFDEIVDFAGVEKFIDTAVRHYSSGMYLRLAFSVAAHLEPEILLVDEVLAVGDVAFQKKCLGKMNEVANEGRTVLFVSHNMMAIQELCSRAILLGAGRILMEGNTDQVVQQHLKNSLEGLVQVNGMDLSKAGRHKAVVSDEIRFTKFYMIDRDDNPTTVVRFGDVLRFQIEFESRIAREDLSIGLIIGNQQDVNIVVLGSDAYEQFFSVSAGQKVCVRLEIPELYLAPGQYNVKAIELRHRRGAPYDHVLYPLQFDILSVRANDGVPKPYGRGLVAAPAYWTTLDIS